MGLVKKVYRSRPIVSAEVGEIVQVCTCELAGLVKHSAGAGGIGQEYVPEWKGLVNSVCKIGWD